MIKKLLSSSLVLLLTVFSSTGLIASQKKFGIGIYGGRSFPLGEKFREHNYPYRHYKNGIDFQLGVYKEFTISNKFSLQADLNLQHFTFQSLIWNDVYKRHVNRRKIEPVISLSLNALYYILRKGSLQFYCQAGAGVGIGKVSFNMIGNPHLHLQAGIGAKIHLDGELSLIMHSRMVALTPKRGYDKSIVFYPGISVGIEF
jgi:hypothetical protein